MHDLTLVQAHEEDLDTVLDILYEAAEWLAERGIHSQWRPGTLSRTTFLEQIRRREVYLARLGEEVVGTVTLQWEDQPFWGNTPPDAGYIHKLAIKRAFAGRGLGLEILEWAEAQARRAGKRFLRLDCIADNPRIREYYERVGFIHRGDLDHSGWKASLYEKKL